MLSFPSLAKVRDVRIDCCFLSSNAVSHPKRRVALIDLMLKELKGLSNFILFYFDRNLDRNTTYDGHFSELEKLSWVHLKFKSMN